MSTSSLKSEGSLLTNCGTTVALELLLVLL